MAQKLLRCPRCRRSSRLSDVDVFGETIASVGGVVPKGSMNRDQGRDLTCPHCGGTSQPEKWDVLGPSSTGVSGLLDSPNPQIAAAARAYLAERGEPATPAQRAKMVDLSKSSVLEVAVAAKRWLKTHSLPPVAATAGTPKAVAATMNKLTKATTRESDREVLRRVLADLSRNMRLVRNRA